MQTLSTIERSRKQLSKATAAQTKSQLGQFFTPASAARFMADLFKPTARPVYRLLDAGAGIGSLSAAFLERHQARDFASVHLEIDAFEIDERLHPYLRQTLAVDNDSAVSVAIHGGDFIETAVNTLCGHLFTPPLQPYTHAILNPPYKKIKSDSRQRALLHQAGIETVNLYAAFVALALALLEEGGQLVAIIPRSFCNGPYYQPFREYILTRAAIRHIHLFESRNKAFKDDAVLQENLIILIERGRRQGVVTISTSADDAFDNFTAHERPFAEIVLPNDPRRFIHIPTSPEQDGAILPPAVCCSLDDLEIQVSTGPVVDFRLRDHLLPMPERGAAPLLYPAHFRNGAAVWPQPAGKKANAIQRNSETEKWLYPNGAYCVTRRFSAKEERRRIIASVVDPAVFPAAPMLGFENHLNVFHANKQGLPLPLAHGLAVFLNTTAVDQHFRRFNGHTQVNATDLRQMPYPNRDRLLVLGQWAMRQQSLTQTMIDNQVEALLR